LTSHAYEGDLFDNDNKPVTSRPLPRRLRDRPLWAFLRSPAANRHSC
jgi:hypothetical protein